MVHHKWEFVSGTPRSSSGRGRSGSLRRGARWSLLLSLGIWGAIIFTYVVLRSCGQ